MADHATPTSTARSGSTSSSSSSLMVLTMVTVAVSQLHLPVAGGDRGGAGRRHRQGLAGGLLLHAPDLRAQADLLGARLTVAFFFVVLLLPLWGIFEPITQPTERVDAMNLKSFHLVFIACSIALAFLFGAWVLGESGARRRHAPRRRRRRLRASASALIVYEAWFLRYSRRPR